MNINRHKPKLFLEPEVIFQEIEPIVAPEIVIPEEESSSIPENDEIEEDPFFDPDNILSKLDFKKEDFEID